MNAKFQNRQWLKGLRWFVIISVISILVILAFTVNRDTIQSLKKIRASFLFLAILVLCIKVYLECLRLQTLTWAFGKFIDFKSSALFTIGGYFLSIVPSGLVGLPLQFYVLKKNGFSLGQGGAIIGMRAINSLIAVIIILPLVGYYKGIIGEMGLAGVFLRYVFIIIGTLIALSLFFVFRKEQVSKIGFAIKRFFTKRGWKKGIKIVDGILNELNKFRYGLKECWGRGIYKLILTIGIGVVSLFVHGLIAPCIFYGLGMSVSIIKAIVIQLILMFVVLFAPTPGASGIAEGAAFALFRTICPKAELLGIYVLIWRFIIKYIGVILGGILIIRALAGKETQNSKIKMQNYK